MQPVPVERRRWARLRSHVPVRYQDTKTQRFVETLSKDVSVGGLRCVTHEFLPASRELLVELSLRRAAPALKTRARVAWVQQIPHADQYCVGLEFLQLPQTAQEDIASYVSNATPSAAHA